EGAEDATVALDVAEAVAQGDGALVGFVHGPSAHLPQDAREYGVAALMPRVQRGEVLREALADPLLVVVAPADRLSPPLVRKLVRDEEVRELVERGGIAAPGERGHGQRLEQLCEV